MGGHEEPRRSEADLALLGSSSLGERSKSSMPVVVIAEIADGADVRDAPWSLACSRHGRRDAGPS